MASTSSQTNFPFKFVALQEGESSEPVVEDCDYTVPQRVQERPIDSISNLMPLLVGSNSSYCVNNDTRCSKIPIEIISHDNTNAPLPFDHGGNFSCSKDDSRELRRKARQEEKQRKDRFFTFIRVLVKYLEQTNEALHDEVREIIRDCTERKARNEPGYESVTKVLRQRIREVVSDACWNRAEIFLEKFLREKASMSGVAVSRMRHHHTRRCSMSSRHTVETTETDDSISLASSTAFPDHHSAIDSLSHFNNPNFNFSANAASTSSSCTWSQHREREYFVLFTRVLVKHLERVEPDGLCKNVRAMIQECVERNRSKEVGYENVTECVRERLEFTVPQVYQEQAHRILQEMIAREQRRRKKALLNHHEAQWRFASRRSSI